MKIRIHLTEAINSLKFLTLYHIVSMETGNIEHKT